MVEQLCWEENYFTFVCLMAVNLVWVSSTLISQISVVSVSSTILIFCVVLYLHLSLLLNVELVSRFLFDVLLVNGLQKIKLLIDLEMDLAGLHLQLLWYYCFL